MSKKKAGHNPVNNIKTSNFLPGVFQTELNKNWLDSTVDQLVSKGPLENINSYIGSRDGKVATAIDNYLETKETKNQLQPGIISYNKEKEVTNVITFDDVAHSINENFSTYNYNAAYASGKYSFNPPIDIDKFSNHVDYHWVEELPVYESVLTTGSNVNPITNIQTNGKSTLTDDNNTFIIENNMLIKFTGASWHADVLNKTYLVAGSVGKHKLYEYIDENDKRVYQNEVKHSEDNDGAWHNNILFNAEPNSDSAYWNASATPQDVVDAYNIDTSKLPLFDGFNFPQTDSSSTYLINNTLVKFAGAWVAGTDTTNIFSITIDATTRNVSITAATATEILSANTTLSPDNNLMYDSGLPVEPLKDYIVIAKDDPFQTAWSRANHWVNISTINKLVDLIPTYDFTEIKNIKRKALRPIIEYNAGIDLWDHAEYVSHAHLGAVDYGVTAGNAPTTVGDTYVFIDSTDYKIYKVASGADTVVAILTDNDTFSIKNSTSSLWKEADAYYINSTVTLAQQKTETNQHPLYRFYDMQGVPLEDVQGQRFTGDKIFGYKIGTGANDIELGFPLSFKDTPKGAEYEFENFILTNKYYTTLANTEYSRSHFSKDQTGYNLFKQRNILKTIYTPAGEVAGASEHAQYKVTIIDEPLIISYGYDNWRPQQEYLIHNIDNQLSITTAHSDGVTNITRTGNAELFTLGTSQELVFHNLTSSAITFTSAGVNIETTPIAEITITRTGQDITLVTSAGSDDTHFNVVVAGVLLQSFIVTKQWDNIFHNITINGKTIAPAMITAGATTIEIDQSILAVDDLIDLYWNNNNLTNKTTNTSLPDVHSHNANNTIIETFTLSETIDHWGDKLNIMPGFNGNNYASIPHTSYYGGTIFMHEDISIMNDINYSDNNLNITGALTEQANEFVAFRKRVSAQARRIWSTTGATTVQGLTDSAINEVIRTKSDEGLYSKSNMLSVQTDDRQEWELIGTNPTNFTKKFKTRFTFNGDTNIRDHVYVYLTEDNGSDVQVRKLLVKDKDYTFISDTVTLNITYAALDSSSTRPKVEVYHTKMDENCFVPPSMVKLGLVYGIEPQVNNNILYTHDGVEIDVAGKDIENISAGATFDPVNAVMFEMEKRIYAGLVKEDTMYNNENEGLERYSSPVEYLPAQHIGTWYTLNNLNNYLEKHYYQWARLNKITSLNTTSYYNAVDPFTWNYSTITVGEHFGTNTLPGHWKGAYTHLFGTYTPHITPWHMLGHAFKPTWWDANYSWDSTDGTKRADLINALNNGIVSNPSGTTTQVVRNARYYWDFATKCPVKTDGTLEDPDTVLGTPANVDKEKAFVFGDWGPVEAQWRLSALGQSIMLDAVLKLNPAKAWTDFFQPGVISKHNSIIRNTNHYNKLLPAGSYYKTPGKTYENTIDYITVKSSPATLESTGYFKILDDDLSTIGRAVYGLNSDGTISAVSLIERGLNFTSQHIISYVGTQSAALGLDLDLKFKQVPFVANGIAQAQYNYMIRNKFAVDLDDLYNNITTKLQAKLNGFSSTHLLNISAETSLTGDFELGMGDFDIKMYKGATTDLVTASTLTITKTLTGYEVAGINNNTREFKFYEPNLINATDYTTQTIASQTVRRYNKFVTTPSIVEYDAEFEKLQDVYNFIRGYWKWMETSGYTLAYDGDSSASDFVTWALTAEVTDGYILQIGREIKFKPDSGHVYEYNQLRYNSNDVLSLASTKLENSQLGISRTDGTAFIETKDKEFIGSITSAVLDYEHIVIFENKTKLGVNIFDDVKNNSQQRLLVQGQRTQNWTGEKKAPGYLIVDDHIVQNFDSAVQSVDDIYRTDVDHFNKSFSKAKDLTIGNIEGTLLDNLGINKNVLTNYYQGVIKDKGTKGAIEHIGKSNLLHDNETTISAFEQYMFRQSSLGNDDMENPLEIEIVSSDINSSPQVITLDTTSTASDVIVATSSKIVNNKVIDFAMLSYDDSDSDILTGGEPASGEIKYAILRSSELSSVFDSTADYAIIPTWNTTTSYKKSDKVRFRGQLWKCNVNFTGLTEVSPEIEVTSSVATSTPILAYGTVANIAGTTVTLQKTEPAYNDIIVTGDNPHVPFTGPKDLTITAPLGDTVTISLSKKELVPVVTGPAVIIANGGPASLSDVTGKEIVINIRNTNATSGVVTNNSTTINFDTTPADIDENFTGVTAQTDFTIAQALSGSTYGVSTVTVDGVAQTDPADYTVTLQTLQFTTAPTAGAAIVVTLVHVPHQMNETDILNRINSYSIANLTTTLETSGSIQVLQLSYQDTNTENDLVLEAGSTNADLFFPVTQTIVAQPAQNVNTDVNMTADNVKDQINNTSATALTNVTASVVSGQLIITKTNNISTSALTFAGDARPLLGLNASTNATLGTPTQVSSSYIEAATAINAELTNQSVTGVTVTVVGNTIKVTSTAASLDLGDTTFNSQIGLATGIIYAAEGNIANDWDALHNNYFDLIGQELDTALYNILITNDSDFANTSAGSVVTKFWSWNVLQVQQNATPLYTLPDPNNTANTTTGCGICAGTSSKDGNDAEITTNDAHGLAVGDWVQLLNTTTTPTIDGIHKVTKVDLNNPLVFYIDEYIEKCGNAVSVMPLVTTRFNTDAQRDTAEAHAHWNLPTGTLVWVNEKDTVRGTYVYKKNATNTYDITRSTTTRPSNKDIDSIVIYNHKDNQSKVQLEVWDPMRKIIPGIAQQNLDYINFSDNAIYTTSTDGSQLTDIDTSWGEEQIGTRWWDISKARYYDYDQHDTVYKARNWGQQYPGSEIIVWEWAKSTVAPDDYTDAVNSNTEMFGTVATGEAYSVYDEVLKETLYYYTLEQEWNTQTSSYNDVYYYWVKNRTTRADTRELSAYEVAKMIEDPTASGVSWFAVIGAKEFIVDNISYYIEDLNTVLQINQAGDKFKSHNEWTLIAKDSDKIPEYYIDRMKRNLAGRDNNKINIPYPALHKFNKYGDDIGIGQSWFNDLSAGRRNAIVTINNLLENINLVDEYNDTWDKTLTANNFPTHLWKWHDYKLKSYTGTINNTTTITEYTDLDSIDRDYHLVAKMNIFDTDLQLDRSETYAYNSSTTTWELVYKKNNTIKFDEGLMCATGGWDRHTFDSTPYDQADIAEYWEILIEALYKDMFVHYNEDKMNTFFFSIVYHVLGSFKQTNWIRKTTYVKLEFTGSINNTTRKYARNKLNNVLGYIDEIKPYHTKSSTVTTRHTNLEEVGLTLTETPLTNITIKPSAYDAVFGGTTYVGEAFGTNEVTFNPTDLTDFTTSYSSTDVISGPDFLDAQSFNYTVDGHNRNSFVKVRPLELLRINVQTNTSGSTHNANSRTFAHIQDVNGYVRAYALTEAKETTLATNPLLLDSTTITVASTTAFDNIGTAYINGELIDYVVVNATTLGIINRNRLGTYKVLGAIGESIMQVDATQLTFANDDPSEVQYNTIGSTILNSPGSIQAQELQSFGKGVEL